MGGNGMDSSDRRWGQVVGSCGRGKKPCVFIRHGKFLGG